MTAGELQEWSVLEEVDPFGQLRLDYHFAQLTARLMTALGLQHKDKRSLHFTDYMPPFPMRTSAHTSSSSQQQSAEDAERNIMMWIKGTNAAFLERGRRPNGS